MTSALHRNQQLVCRQANIPRGMATCGKHRRLTLVLSVVVLFSHLAAIHLYQHLPDDPHHIAWHLSNYSYFATVLATLGFVGARKNNATLVSIFANYLLVDTIICIIPRVALVAFFPSIKASICSLDTIHAWLVMETQSSVIAADEKMRCHMMGQCRMVVGVLQALLAFFAAAFTIVQIVLSVRVAKYATSLRYEEDIAMETEDYSKRNYDEQMQDHKLSEKESSFGDA